MEPQIETKTAFEGHVVSTLHSIDEKLDKVDKTLVKHDAQTAKNAGMISWIKGGIAVAAFIITAYIAYIKL